ncbi:hypothetical protein TCA2_3647 [Paenibacillus sp. TCA20]|uniref:NAD(P)H-dependent oxidoreductase n=1 Tax=Paenibacillus TaxID=44249 RepID=UPI0004D9E74F|nr:NAD(P)H-dependent oxidoreductase [Paenibacillus sp. TCA20]GAK41156.1 hypothetical protein TCA2_3647 [Paenibacillus sp. TCA20]
MSKSQLPVITIILGHPDRDSYCTALAQAYMKGAREQGATVHLLELGELSFNPNLKYGYRQRTELEPDLLYAQEMIKQSDHIVLIYPLWWGSMPALLKGFFDRILLPHYAYLQRPSSLLWDKLLNGKTAHLIVTMDTPSLYYRLIYGRAGHRVVKQGIFGYCGIKTRKITEIGPVKTSTDVKRHQWLSKIYKLGAKLA